MKVKVLLVDDHRLVLGGLRLQLKAVPDVEVVGEAVCGSEALERARELSPDLVVLDMHLPDMNGKELARKLLAEHPRLKILVLSSDSDIELVKEVLRIGVAGYLLKENTDRELFHAVSAIMAGEIYLCPQVNALFFKDYQKFAADTPTPPKPVLTQRQQQLLKLIAEGKRSKEIAAQLDVDVKSVDTFRARLMQKLGCDSVAELVRYAIREGISKV